MSSLHDRLKQAFAPYNCNHDLRKDKEEKFSLKKLPHCNLGIDYKNLVKCSVLILLFQTERKLHVLLTIRSFKLKSYPGELCFPGGKFDDSLDTSFEQTAYREANEEIGLDQDNLCILGKLCPIISPIGHYIVPVVGLICNSKLNSPKGDIDAEETLEVVKRLQPNPDEVEDIVHVPLSYVIENADDPNTVLFAEENFKKVINPEIVQMFVQELKAPVPEKYRRLLIFFKEDLFTNCVKPNLNFLYGINASLLFFCSYLFEKELNVDPNYSAKFEAIDEMWQPVKVLKYPNVVRIYAFLMYKFYLAEKKTIRPRGPKPKL